jgi:hypothetical protein
MSNNSELKTVLWSCDHTKFHSEAHIKQNHSSTGSFVGMTELCSVRCYVQW